jgi:hypothetical protein
MNNFSAISWWEQVQWDDDDVCFVLDQHWWIFIISLAFSLTCPYCTWDKHNNHYTTDVVCQY